MADNFLDRMAGISNGDDFLDRATGLKKKAEKTLTQRIAGTVAPFARPVLEAGGMTLGGILGATGGALTTLPAAGTGAIPAGIAGAGLGYAAGRQGANFIDSLAGEAPRKSALEKISDTGKDFATGGLIEMGGPVIGAAGGMLIKPIAKPISQAISKIPLTVKNKAGAILQKATQSSPVYAKNAEEAAALESQIPGFKASLGERTNNPELIRLQRALEKGTGEAANVMGERRATNIKAIRDYMDSQFNSGRNIDDVIDEIVKARSTVNESVFAAENAVKSAASRLKGTDAQTVGKAIHGKIKEAIEPVLKQEKELWSKVENYPIPTGKTESAINEALNIPSTAEKAIKRIRSIYQKTPPTVQGLRRVEMEIDSAINSQAATATERHYLRGIKKGIQDDLESLGAAADSGKIMVHNGKVVYPDALKKEASEIPGKISEAMKGMKDKPDVTAIMTALRDKQVPFVKAVGEGQEAYIKRITDQYQKSVGPDIPMIKAQEPPTVQAFKNRETEINRILSEAQPADNVAQAIKTARDFSREQKFGRFDKGAVKDILRKGAEINGRTVPDAEVARRFMNVDDADQLIKAIGQNNAKEVMGGFVVSDFEKSVIDKTTGEISERLLNNWMAKNGQVLDRYGLKSGFQNVQKARTTLSAMKAKQVEFEKSIAAKMLNADPMKAIEAAMSGGEGIGARNTGAIMSKLMRQLKGNPDAVNGLKNAFKDFLISKSENAAKTISGQRIISPAKIQNEIRKYEPAMKMLYADEPRKLAALQNVQKAIETMARSTVSPTGGGSDTYELATAGLSIIGTAIGKVPGVSTKVELAKKGLEWFNRATKEQVATVLSRAIYDPEMAEILMMAKRNVKPTVVRKRLAETLERFGIYSTMQIRESH